jgi:Ankyrin repeats (many copies)
VQKTVEDLSSTFRLLYWFTIAISRLSLRFLSSDSIVMFVEPKSELSANEVYAKFIDSEKKYGHLSTFSDQFSSKWKHLRVSTSLAAFWTYYECPQDVSRQLISRDFCPDATKALFLICNCANVKSYQVGDLLKLRADPNCQSSRNSDTPLHRLIRLCKVKAVRLLVNWGADINRPNIAGKTPLMTACDCIESKKQLLIVSNLLQNKSLDLNAWDNEGNTAVTLTVRASNIWTLRELLISGTSIITAAKKGRLFSANDSTSPIRTSAYQIWLDSIDRQKMGESDCNGTDGIQYADKSTLYIESVRRLKDEVCFLMIQRKASEEFHKINQGNDRLKTMQKVYRKGDRSLPPKKREPTKAKLPHTDPEKDVTEDMYEIWDDDEDFDSSSTCLEDVDMERDKMEFDK